jgi:NADPH:quinone reductase-like Zn-dependent oxidoreductase
VRALVRDAYGSPDSLELRELPTPVPGEDEVLVRVRAASVNPVDWYDVTGTPYVSRPQLGIRRPKSNRVGSDFAGEVEAAGSRVTRFAVGDAVFGARHGAFAEYVTVPEDRAIATVPDGLTLEEAAAAPIAGVTALQGLRDRGALMEGRRVLVNGASGGVGTFAVQIAKALGGVVTAVCSGPKVDLVRSLGADRVVDYTREDFTRGDERYELMLDVAGSRSFAECRRVLEPNAKIVIVGAPKGNRALGPLTHVIAMRLASLRSRQSTTFFIAKLDPGSLGDLRELLAGGRVRPVIDRRYELDQVADALRYLGEGHARAKIVVTA